jgi:PAS domain S-box-containing protein
MIDLSDYSFEKLRDDGELTVSRGRRATDGASILLISAASEHPSPSTINRIKHAYSLRNELDSSWAIRPLELLNPHGIPALLLDDPGGEFLDGVLGRSPSLEELLPLAVAITRALGFLHARQLIHRDVKPANVVVNLATNQSWLTGFGLTSRLPRYRQLPDPPDGIAGTLAYIGPEQTGRMNRSIDSRSDLYSLGVTLYEMFVGVLPFEASDAMGWVHCHIARLPVAPNLRRSGIPEPLSAIILKLLAKTPEERYQTAAGVEADLRRILCAVETRGAIEFFPLGARDVPDRLLIPEKLYGREREVELLLAAFERVVSQGTTELVLVSGYSGIGKSSVVNELHNALVPPRGLFASGKFDQYKRDIPYATLAQAFQGLIRPLLSKSESELNKWRDALHEALDPNGALIVELVPELKHIIGEQSAVPELSPSDAQRRFQLVFRNFINVFARPEHPLALFLDDLQWVDAATLDLVEDLLSRADVHHLLLIGAYRGNEVHSTHPLTRRLDAMRQAEAALREISLTPLGREDLQQLVVDALRCEPARAAPLAQLIHQKTTGNPFFAIQFISALADEALLHFDYGEAQWTWDLQRIRAKGYTDNVVDLMVGMLGALPAETQKALQQFACIGNSAECDLLRMVYQESNESMHERLWPAVRSGLIFRSEYSYHFLHDRVQEAAYSLIPQGQRALTHLRIGTILARNTPPERLEETIFDIVNQLNRGSQLITSAEERERVAELNLIASKRAKVSTAYDSALKYLRAGSALLTEETWERNYKLVFAIEYLIAECELLTAEMVAAETRLAILSQRASSRHEVAVVTRLQLTLYTTLDRSDQAITVFLDYLRRYGTDWSERPSRDDVMREYDQIWSLLGSRQIEDLVDLPLMSDPDVLDMLDVFTEIVHAAMFFDEHLSSLAVCRMVSLSLEHGICDASCFGYVWFGMFAGPRFNNYKDGFRFGQLGYDLVEKRGLLRYQARTYISFGTLTPWAKHAAEGRELVRRAFDVAYRMGDLTFAAYSWHELITNYLAVGDGLAEVQTEAERGLAFVKKAGFGLVAENLGAQLGLIRTLRGVTRSFGCFNDQDYDESEAESRLAGNPVLALAEFFYWTRKLQGRFFAGDYAGAVDASTRAHQLLWPAASQLETGDFRFYGALAHAAAWKSASADERRQHFDALIDHHRQLKIWAEHCPANYENRTALVGAEIARIEGRILDAEQLYEKAMRSSHANGFAHNEAVANELAARFYENRGFEIIAETYLRNARYCYLRWGAAGKLRQLDALYPRLGEETRGPGAKSTIGESVEHLDLTTVIKVSEAVSGEIVLDKLIDKLMRIAIEHAGAERGLLILPRGDQMRIQAEATTSGDTVIVRNGEAGVTTAELPESIVHFVGRTHENVILDEATAGNPFSLDPYIRLRRARSVLCLPLLKQAKMIGILYLENSLASHVFTPARVVVLKMLASSAAMSLENATLFTDLQLQVGVLQHLPVSAWTLKPDGTPDFVNQVWLKFSGQTPDFIRSHPEAWMTAVHPEDRETASRAFWDGVRSGRGFAMETRSLRAQDGTYRWHLNQAVVLRDAEGRVLKFVGTTTDIDDQKRAEEALRQTQTELAHVARMTTMGELTASMAHEINQPLSGIITNAGTCLRMLAADPPNIEGARETAQRTIRDGHRASDVINRLRALFSKKAPTIELVDLNEATREVIALSRSELQKNQAILSPELADGLPTIAGDRVQLQQVILNLLLNASEAMRGVDDRPRKLVVRTEPDEGDHVRLSVKDAGVGFEAQSANKLFQAFYTTKSGGMGIGLSVSRSIIESHRGRLWASPNDGPGATFSFYIPCNAESATGAHGVESVQSARGDS